MDAIPFQSHDLTTAASGDEQQMGDQPPFQRFEFKRLYSSGDLFRLKIVDRALLWEALHGWQRYR